MASFSVGLECMLEALSLPVKEEFCLPEDCIYLDGNSLGVLPVRTREILDHAVQAEWGQRAIRSWNEDWMAYPRTLAEKLGPILGAKPGNLLFCDNVSTNLFKLLHSGLAFNPERKKILTDDLNFPSDLYVLQGVVEQLNAGHEVVRLASEDGIRLSEAELVAQMDADCALVYLTHVSFKSGFMHDMRRITQVAHERGARVLWDLSHSVGAVPLELDPWGVDLAVGCSYKYLNGGPGAPAFLYVSGRLQDRGINPIQGWFGSNRPFDFALEYVPTSGIERFHTGTPPMLSLKGIEAGLDILNRFGMKAIRRQSELLSSRFIAGVTGELKDCGFEIASPMDAGERGSHVSIRHVEAQRINQALIEPPDGGLRVIPDFRAPDHIRFGFAPLYNSIEDIDRTIQRLGEMVRKRLYEQVSIPAAPVT